MLILPHYVTLIQAVHGMDKEYSELQQHDRDCTVAHWKNGQIDEENLFYDQVGMMIQLGLK
jgi:hypothetical protein